MGGIKKDKRGNYEHRGGVTEGGTTGRDGGVMRKSSIKTPISMSSQGERKKE